jgi:hypothetical protein
MAANEQLDAHKNAVSVRLASLKWYEKFERIDTTECVGIEAILVGTWWI